MKKSFKKFRDEDWNQDEDYRRKDKKMRDRRQKRKMKIDYRFSQFKNNKEE